MYSNPWKRVPKRPDDYYTPAVAHYYNNLIDRRPKFSVRKENKHLDIHTKRSAVRASHSIVALKSYSGEEDLYQCSGTIIDTDGNCNGIIITSANLIRRATRQKFGLNIIADKLKIVVKLSNGESCDGEVLAYEFHYNLAVISFKANSELSIATLRIVNDCLNVNPSQPIDSELTSFQLRRHSRSIILTPGDALVAAGRYFAEPFDLMAAPGEYSLDRSEYDCMELFMATCLITRCGDGGPLLNHDGEVIGIAFYDATFTPFIPINVAYKWWEHYKTYGELRRPLLGMEAIAFHSARLDVAEKVVQSFPSISKGVIVEKTMSGSPADSAGLRLNDVIIQCGGKVVCSFLELFEIIWDNVGSLVDLVVARTNHVTPLSLKMMVDEPTSHNLNRWPYWK